jgi:hypothetical protein
VEIAVVKGVEGGRDRVWVTLDDGTSTQVAVHVIHDLPHLVVESMFQIEDGLWGVLAAGGFRHANDALGRREQGRAKVRLVTDAPLDDLARAGWPGHVAVKVLTNAVVNRWQEGPDTADGVRERVRASGDERAAESVARVDDATIERAIRGVTELYGRWAATPPGGTLRLTWPLTDLVSET